MPDQFVHLHLHSQFSLLDGAIKFGDLFEKTKKYGMNSVAITDHGNLFGAFEFYNKAKDNSLKPIIGCEIYITPTLEVDRPSEARNHHLILLAMNQVGYKNLSNIVSRAYFEGFYRKPRIDHEVLNTHSEGLIALSGCLNGELCSSILEDDMKKALGIAAKYKDIFGDRYYLEVQANDLKEQQYANEKVKYVGKSLKIPVVATNDCHFLNKHDSKPHDVLLCIQTGATLQDENRLKFKGEEYYFKSADEMLSTLENSEDEIYRTSEVAERCNFEFETTGYKLPVFNIENRKTLEEYLGELSSKNLKQIFEDKKLNGSDKKIYEERLQREIKTINDMGFAGYFLVVADFINFAKSKGIPVGPGRGSAAGSLVAYALGITEVDPIPYNLIFERFLNPERVSMPDIDVDFCGEGRDEVIDYVTKKYGKDKVAQIGTFGTMSAKAVIKDVGRVMGIPYADVDRLSKLIPSFRGKVFSIEDSIKQVPEIQELIDNSDELKELIELAKPLENMVRHSSTHAAGVVISNEHLSDYIPLYKGSNNEIVTQFDMNSIESLGYVKFDFLGLKTLTVINRTLKLIKEEDTDTRQIPDLKNINLNDPEVYKLLLRGFTRGIFQIESPGMKEVLVKLQPTDFEDLIALLALYRPGPLDSGMVNEFIKRKHGEKEIDYPLPELQDVLKDTYGLFVYQEQIMSTASVVAEYTMGEADLLRRAMGKKKPAEMKAQRKRFLEGSRKNGVSQKKAKEIFDNMEKFAEYSFNKSHSTAYAIITYQTAYLKTYYAPQFMAALMSVEANNTDKVIADIAECRDMGIDILPPDVNESLSGFTSVIDKIRFGLSAIKNIGESTIDSIIKTREESGKFNSIFDLCSRIDSNKINRRSMESLIKSGAFDSIHTSRAQLSDSIEILLNFITLNSKLNSQYQNTLFPIEDSISFPELSDVTNWNEKETLKNELEVLGFYVTSHPMEKYAEEIKKFTNNEDSESIKDIPDGKEASIAGVVRSLKVRHTKRGTGIFGNLVLEDLKGSVEVVIFNDLLKKSLPLLEDRTEPLILKGVVENSEERTKMRATSISSLKEIRNSSTVNLIIDKELADNKHYQILKNTFNNYPGNSKIQLHIQTLEGEAVIEIGDYKVDIDNLLIEELEETLGKGTVHIT